MSSFSKFKLMPSLLKSLKDQDIKTPTQIQDLAIPILLEGKSVVGVSETGSGKTLTYVLPLLQILKTLEADGYPVTEEAKPRAVIVVPTRELGEQISRVFKSYTHTTRLRVRSLLGGRTLQVGKENIKGPFEILVATPGRLIQVIGRDLINLEDVLTLVFDEADQMLDQGFFEDMNRIAEKCPMDRQMGLFSATVSPAVESLMERLFKEAVLVRSENSNKLVATLATSNRKVIDGKRMPILEQVLEKPTQGGTLIFTNTREQCDILADLLTKKGIPCLIYRGEMDKVQRRANLKKFRLGEIGILISTDLASRGLDVEHVGRVINYHLPKELDNYLHRVGRTARAGRKGLVVNLVTERDAALMSKLEKVKTGAK